MISNEQLSDLDAKVADFYKLSARYLHSLSNLYGRKVYKDRLDALLREADSINPSSEFDSLLLRNIRSNLELNDIVFDYFSDPSFSMSVKDFFDTIGGQGAWDYLEEKVKSPPWEKRWIHSEKTQERQYSLVNPFSGDAQVAAGKWLPQIKQDIIEYGISEGYLPQGFEMKNIILLPPKDGSETSNWNPKTNIFSLGSYGFEFFYQGDRIIAKPTRAYNVAFHEVLGHGAHQANSIGLPSSLTFTEEVGSITPTKSITEGVAIDAEKRCYPFLKERLDRLGITSEDADLLSEENELENQTRCEYLYGALLKDWERKEKDLTALNISYA